MQIFAGLHIWALPLAAAVSFIFGAIWYGVLSRQWRAAANLDASGPAANPPWPHLLITFLAQLVTAWMFAGVLLHLSQAGIPATLRNGVICGVFLWAGFILMPMIVNHMYQGAKRSLTVIDGAHWLGVMVLQGAVLGIYALIK